jgi:hypothetical protein
MVYKRRQGVEQASIAAPGAALGRKRAAALSKRRACRSLRGAAEPAFASGDRMLKIIAAALCCAIGAAAPALARNPGANTWAGNTAEDMVAEQDACRDDAYRFCGGNTIFIFEMENCLKERMRYLSKRCRRALAPTDFRKYYRAGPDPFDF